jgi:hypothetical protein
MTHIEKIEAIREACIKVNSDITKVQFGCKYRVKNRPRQIFTIISNHEIASIKDVEKEIIGRDVQLADVLLFLQNTNIQICFYGDSKIWLISNKYKSGRLNATWNLLKPLHLQDESTINFLYELI